MSTSEHGWVPIPDPTTLTTAALDRAVTGMDGRIDTRVEHLRELTDERFRAVELRFHERDLRLDLQGLSARAAADKAEAAGAASVASVLLNIADLKDRVSRLETSGAVTKERAGAMNATIGSFGVLAAALISIASLLVFAFVK